MYNQMLTKMNYGMKNSDKHITKALAIKPGKSISPIFIRLSILLIFFGVIGNTWGQTPTNGGFEDGITNWTTAGSAGTTNARTGSNALAHTTSSTSNIAHTNSTTISVANNAYAHVIGWAIGSNSNSRASCGGTLNTTANSATILTIGTTLTRLTYSVQNTSGSSQNFSCRINTRSNSGSTTVYWDDVIVYTNSSATADVTDPTTATAFTNGSITPSSIAFSWTNGSDAATGIQNTIILRTTNTSATTPSLNDQGVYSISGGTSGPNNIGDWTVISVAVTSSTTSYIDNTVAAGTSYKYAIIHRDLAYNYSTALVSGTITSSSLTPSIALSSPTIPTSAINNNTNNNIVGAVQLAVTTADATLNSATFTTAGTYTASDIATNGFKFWLSSSATDISGATQLGSAQAAAGTGSNISVSGLNSSITSGTTRFIVLTADIAASPTNGATIGITSTAHSNITFASGTKTGTDPVAAGTTRSISVATPDITLSSPVSSSANLTQGLTNQEIYRFDLAVTTAAATLNGVTITTAGTYVASDLTNIKCWYSADATFNSNTDELLATKTTSLGAGSHAFPSFTTKTISSGTTGYIFITVDLPFTATANNAISVNAITTADISFVSGNKTGTANASGTKTIIECTPTNVTGLATTTGNGTLTISWTNPSCSDEIMIVAKPTSSVSATPSGDGSVYTANLAFGTGGASSFDGTGFVVYKGSTSPQTITGLTNGTNYFVDVFTRKGTTWSSGSEVSATPVATSSSTDYFRSKATGNWTSISTWESSSDNLAWIDATLAPTSAANTISIRNGHDVTINSNITIDQVEINNGGTITYSGGTITVANGTGDDISIQSGGRMIYSVSSTTPTFNSGATLLVLNGGFLRVQATGITGAGSNVNNSSHIYSDGAILEYNSSSNFSASGVTFFPNVTSETPIFRLLQSLTSVGGGSATVFNGRFELANGITITWGGNGNKTFRNGITGLGGVNSCTVASGTGQFLITGTSNLGSSGSLTVTNANGVVFSANTNLTGALTIGSGTTLSLASGILTIGSNTLTLNGSISRTSGNIDASNATATVVFSGSSSQSIPDGTFTGNINNLTVNNSNGLTNNQSVIIAGTLTLTAGVFDANNVTTLNSTSSLIYNGGSMINYTIPTSLNNFTLPTGTTALSNDISLTGNLNLGSNTLDIGSNTLTINGDITRTTGSIKTNGGKLILEGTSSSTLHFDQTTDGTTNNLKDLTINRTGATVTLGNKLQIAHNGTVTVTTGTLAASGNLVLTSTLGGTARIAELAAGAAVSGNVEIQRYMVGGASSQRGWRYMSSPVASSTYAQLIDDIFITGPGGASNGFDWTGNSSSVMTYEESSSRGWKNITSPSNTWNPGKGAIVFFRGDRTQTSSITNTNVAPNSFALDYSGNINSGSFTINLDYDNTTGVAANQGWNLIGNPYPSQIDWDLVTKTSGVNSHYYLINPTSKNYLSANTGIIAIGQGFFVQVNASGQSVSFEENDKTSSNGTAYFKTATNPLTIKMHLDSVQNDVAKIFFVTGASQNYLFTEDAIKLNNAVYNLSIVTPNNIDVQNSYVPHLGNTGTDTFELKVTSTTNTSYYLSFDNFAQIPSGKAILLLDKQNNSITNLRLNGNYQFAINNSQSSSFGNRFLLIITDQHNSLPLKLTQFSGASKGLTNELTWVTVSEKNIIGFEVQKSDDGFDFETIGFVKANNQQSTSKYLYTDNQSKNTKVYYRLKINERNLVTFSHVVVLNNELQQNHVNQLQVFPNPAQNSLSINLIDNNNIGKIYVFDLFGKLMQQHDGVSQIDVSKLSSGSYIIQVEVNDITYRVKFTKN